ncbi:MAG: hypothetical protein JWO15_2287 [Sphingomonadales bacterium]|nr:hypothetical protein [Sphingomonadales bacterium]
MNTDPFQSPSLQSGYTGDEKTPPELEESSKPVDIQHDGGTAGQNRGRRAPGHGSGAAIGSGAGAGGGGGPEDFDDDAKNGDGSLSMTPEDEPDGFNDGHNENSS